MLIPTLFLTLLSLTHALTLSKHDLAPTSCDGDNIRAYCENGNTVKFCTHEQDGHGRPVDDKNSCRGGSCVYMINNGEVACAGDNHGMPWRYRIVAGK